jgi:hypothetical protein
MRSDAPAAFFARFASNMRSHGHFRPEGPERERDGKQGGFAETVHAPVDETLWDGHLSGVYGLGLVPVMDDGTCCWGAIDIDIDMKPNLVAIAQDAARMELPLIPCRTKSGGVHLYLFCSEKVSATLVRGKLMEWSVALGVAGVEVFPKQVRLAGAKDLGNWINLPYFNGDDTVRYAIKQDGTRLNVDEFLALAHDLAVSASELEEIGNPTDMTFEGTLAEAPPCLQCIVGKGGPGPGHGNKMMFNIGIYLRKRFGDEWEQHFDAYNREPFMDTPRGHKEMQGLVKSVNRKNYEYTCNESPIAQACVRQICLTRKFGIGTGEDDPGVVFGSLVKIETMPPVWIWDVDGARLELTTEQLKDQGRFHTACIEVLNKWPRPMKPAAWSTLIREKLQHVEAVPAPPEAKPEGMMWSHLQAYTTGRVVARSREELINDKPWTPSPDEAVKYGDQVRPGRTYFRAGHFKQYLEQQRMGGLTQRELWSWLRKRGAEHHEFNINGRMVTCWSIPAFTKQTDAFQVPRIADADDM